jgi:hypothetical protein
MAGGMNEQVLAQAIVARTLEQAAETERKLDSALNQLDNLSMTIAISYYIYCGLVSTISCEYVIG